jgi:hypothetical protein
MSDYERGNLIPSENIFGKKLFERIADNGYCDVEQLPDGSEVMISFEGRRGVRSNNMRLVKTGRDDNGLRMIASGGPDDWVKREVYFVGSRPTESGSSLFAKKIGTGMYPEISVYARTGLYD